MRPATSLFRIEPAPDGSGLLFHARYLDPRLRVRTPATAVRPAHPGTAVAAGGRLHEVVSLAGGDPPWPIAYRLRPWDERETIRTVFDLSPEGLTRFEAELAAEIARTGRLRRLARLAPLVGLLPAARQQALEREVGLSALRATLASAWLLFPPALIGTACTALATFTAVFGAEVLPAPPVPLAIASLYLALESFARLRSGQVMGSAPVAAAVHLLERTGALAPLPRSGPAAGPAADDLVDRITRLPAPGGSGAELVIDSALHRGWVSGTSILHEGAAYTVQEGGRSERDGRVRFVHRLLPSRPGDLLRRHIAYRPDEALVARREARARAVRDRLAALGPLAGFAPACLQERWRRDHGFDPRRATLRSAVLEAVLPWPGIQASLAALDRFPELILPAGAFLLVALGLVLEGILRLAGAAGAGRPRGSVLLGWMGRDRG